MSTIRFVLGDQLTRSVSSLADIDKKRDVVLMTEAADETRYVPHHKQKIAFILSAMRHFADELRKDGIRVDYIRLDDPENSGSFGGELARALKRHRPERIIITEPGEWRVLKMIQGWEREHGVPVEIRADERFFCSRERFGQWAKGRKLYRMEDFYREMRRETGILMDAGKPMGGRWNFDSENRKRLPAGLTPPATKLFKPDAITREVLKLVAEKFPDNFGDLDEFIWPVTRKDALAALDEFIAEKLPRFGDYQDAMTGEDAFLFHSLLSAALNVGLLTAREVCCRAEDAYRAGDVPLNSAEGFIRQILGWREYIRGVYWHRMPAYAETNALNAKRKLPWFYWSGETKMRCVASAVEHTRRFAYSHHIQRLMVTGNFALLAGVRPAEIEEWYLAVYADAFDWVELPNTHGMAIHADGGLLASKPYAASGAYINRMSDFCTGCEYDVKKKSGADACPFNYLYWAFLIRNKKHLSGNPRMLMPYRTLQKWDDERRQAILREADAFLDGIE